MAASWIRRRSPRSGPPVSAHSLFTALVGAALVRSDVRGRRLERGRDAARGRRRRRPPRNRPRRGCLRLASGAADRPLRCRAALGAAPPRRLDRRDDLVVDRRRSELGRVQQERRVRRLPRARLRAGVDRSRARRTTRRLDVVARRGRHADVGARRQGAFPISIRTETVSRASASRSATGTHSPCSPTSRSRSGSGSARRRHTAGPCVSPAGCCSTSRRSPSCSRCRVRVSSSAPGCWRSGSRSRASASRRAPARRRERPRGRRRGVGVHAARAHGGRRDAFGSGCRRDRLRHPRARRRGRRRGARRLGGGKVAGAGDTTAHRAGPGRRRGAVRDRRERGRVGRRGRCGHVRP